MLIRVIRLAASFFRRSKQQTPQHARVNLASKLLFLIIFSTAVSNAQAGLFCVADFGGLIDGSDPTTVAAMVGVTQISIDGNCTFANWNPFTATINFTGPAPGEPNVYLIVFDNVVLDGNMACANIIHKLWMVNGSYSNLKNSCQDLVIPVETIHKAVPSGKTSVGKGESFTYHLTLPYMQAPAGIPSPNELHNVIIQDDVTAASIGAELTITNVAISKVAGSGSTSLIMTNDADSQALCGTNTAKHLCLKITDTLAIGDQYQLDVTVVVDNVVGNSPGTVFTNTAKWWYGRNIDVDGNGTIEPWEQYTPLPGESGVSEPLVIAEPNLVMDKYSSESVVNLNQVVPFTLNIQNTGGSSAFNTRIVDNLPENDGTNGGMCNTDPTGSVVAGIYAANGTTLIRSLDSGDYTLTWNNAAGTPACQLQFTVTSSDGAIGPTERLIIRYDATHDGLPAVDGYGLTNVAGATDWYSGDVASQRTHFTGTVLTGTNPNEDAYTIIQGLTGYYFQKTVENVTSGQNPAVIAAPGDVLRYHLRVFNVDSSINITDPVITDTFSAADFNLVAGLSNVVIPAGASYTFIGGVLTVNSPIAPGNVIGAGTDYVIEFDIQLSYSLSNADIVANQAHLTGSPTYDVYTDDPNKNGIVNLGDPTPPPSDTTDVTIQKPGAMAKALTSGASDVTIGDTVTYRITVPNVAVDVPIYDVHIRDDISAAAIGADLEFVSASATLEVGSANWTLSNSGSATDLDIEENVTGIDIPAGDRAFIDITLRVANTLNNQALDAFTNTAYYLYNRTDGNASSQTTGQGASSSALNIVEPSIALVNKSVNIANPVPGDTIEYTVTITANTGAGYSNVFDVTLLDNLDLGLAYVPGTTTVSVGAGVGADNAVLSDPIQLGDGISNAQILLWTTNEVDIDIQAGDVVTVTYQVKVLEDVLANQTLNNSVEVLWTGIDGPNSYERTGIDGIGGINDYITAPQTASVITPNISATISKDSSTDTYGSITSPKELRIGDVIEYTLNISIPHGTIGNVILTDVLPKGLTFEGIRSINGDTTDPFSASGSFTHNDITAASVIPVTDGVTGETTVTWTLGSINNGPSGGDPEIFVIKYLARVTDNTLTQVNSTPLTNNVDLFYDKAGPVTIQTSANYSIAAIQPNLSVSKSATASGGDIVIDAGETIAYTVDIENTGDAPAYDIVVQDTIPAGLRTGGITMVSAQLLVAGTNLPLPSITYDSGTGIAIWDLDTGIANDYTIPKGDTLRLDYTVTADAAIAGGLTLTNAAVVNLYYSFDDDAVPSMDSVTGIRQVYGPSNTAGTTLYSAARPTKSLLSPSSPAEAAIGDEIVYQLTVPGSASQAALFDVQITDALDSNLELVSAIVSGVSGAVDTSTSAQLNIGFASIPAGQQAVIELHVRVRNILSAQIGTTIDNSVSYTYAYTSGGTMQAALTSSDSVTVTIIEPTLTLVTSSSTPNPVAGQTITYSVELNNAGGVNSANAYDVTLTSTLDIGLIYQGSPMVTVGGSGNSIGVPMISGDGINTPQTLVWSLANSNADIDVLKNEIIIVTYDVLVADSVLAGQLLNNTSVAQWTSLDDASLVERDGSDGIGGLNDYITVPTIVGVTTPSINATINKIRVADTYDLITGVSEDNVRVGDIVQYSITLSLPEGTVGNVIVEDSLPKGLQFEAIGSIDGATSAPYTAPGSSAFSYSPIAASSIVVSGDASTGVSTVTWNLGNINNPPVDGLANDFVLVYYARVLNNSVLSQSTLPIALNNTAKVIYSISGGTVENTDMDTNISVVQPFLAVSKSAAPSGGNSEIDANEAVTYTVTIANTGGAPAYDVVVQDVLPVGMRNASPVITVQSATLLPATSLAVPGYSYDAPSGTITFDLDSGTADTYTIPSGGTLQIVYVATSDSDLGPGLLLTNAATATLYYSFDDENVPIAGGVSGQRQVYGPTNTANTTLTTAVPGALQKDVPAVTDVTIGETFSYTITVPATPLNLQLHDVRILDNLAASGADLSFVSVTKISGSQSWTPTNTGNATSLIIEDTTNGIDIPPMEQISIRITVLVNNNTTTNVKNFTFANTASYTYNKIANDAGTRTDGVDGISADMRIVEPDILTLQKAGPANVIVGTAATYSLSIHNSGNSSAYDATIVDYLPNPTPGGMCDTAPNNFVLQMYLPDATTTAGTPLVENTDFTSSFVSGSPNCTLTFIMTSTAAAIPADYWLKISYDAYLDGDTPDGTVLDNTAGVTQWFSLDTAGSGATGQIRTYSETITDGSSAILDFQDVYTSNSQSPQITFQKYVNNLTTGASPATTASPGDILHYVITATNTSPIPAPNFTIIDDIDALNATAYFVANTLSLTAYPGSADISNTLLTGGSKGSGLVDVRNLSLEAVGGANTLTIEFDIQLKPVMDSGTVVLNQSSLQLYTLPALLSDDPAIGGTIDPTPITITSAPQFQIYKISSDITGSSTILLPGDTLRYTITVKNIGNENAVNAKLVDNIPTNTTYVAGSTRLNGVLVADPSTNVSPLQSGMSINSPDDTTAGHMTADASVAANNTATITFDVKINSNVVDGTIISNQGYLNAVGAGSSGAVAQQPSDDPTTTTVLNDPTRDIVGSVPLIDVIKTVQLIDNLTTPNVVDATDTLRYTITITNYGGVQATGVTLTDAVPANSTYVADSVKLNGLAVGVPDSGVSPLIAGIPVSSSDLTPPLPTIGYLTPGATATVTFDVIVNAVAPGTVISNQGYVDSNEQARELSDADGNDSNGDQATVVVVGNIQQLSINKTLQVVGGGPAVAGGQLEYIITVTNIGSVVATNVIVYDDLSLPVPNQKSYVMNSALLDGLSAGTNYAATTVSADYFTQYGNLEPGESFEFRFKVDLDSGLNFGDIIDNTATVYWDNASKNASDSEAIVIGAIPGYANLNGRVWHDANFNDSYDSGERALENWSVQVYFKNNLIGTVSTDSSGQYQIPSLPDNYLTADRYELRFVAPGAVATSAKLGTTTAPLPFVTGMHAISNIILYPSTNVLNLNLPIDPDGVVYNSVMRTPVPGTSLTLVNAATNNALPTSCFDDPAQQGQVTLADGYYKFDINFTQSECPSGGSYLIQVVAPNNNYQNAESVAIPATTNANTAAYSLASCVNDALTTPSGYCEAQTSEFNQALTVPAGNATRYYLHLSLDNGATLPQHSQLFNNHIPLDPKLGNALTISKKAGRVHVSRGEMVPYTITIQNTLPIVLNNVTLYDNIPAGFKYVPNSMRINGVAIEPSVDQLLMSWTFASLEINKRHQITMLLAVGSGVQEGDYVNRVVAFSPLLNANISPEAQATVRVVPDPTFDCSDITGKVYDDLNRNGNLDDGEPGIAGARLATVRGLLITSDKYGRFHITCAAVPNEQRGSDFVLKLDTRSLPSGYRMTTDNPQVKTLTRGKMAKINFGATIHHVVNLSVGDGAFKPDSSELRPQWVVRLGLALEQLLKQDSVLRITYLADVEREGLVRVRVKSLIDKFESDWRQRSDKELDIEHEIFWRHGGPVDQAPGEININNYINSVLNRDNIAEDTEKQLPHNYRYTPWMQDPSLFNHEAETKIETTQVKQKRFTTKKLVNVVPPVLFKSGKADIPEELVEKLRKVLDEVRDKVNVRLHFVGHTDNVQLRGKLAEEYGDNLGLSKERAGTTAEFFQRALELPPEAISYDGKGDSEPVASNDKEEGRSQNRRVEVEVWYDEVSEETIERKVEVEQASERIMVCRVETLCKLRYKEGHSRRAKLKNLVPPFHYEEGITEVPADYLAKLQQALKFLAGKDNITMHFIAHTDNTPLSERDARIYLDQVGLSKALSRRFAVAVQEAMKLPNKAVASSGKGGAFPLASNNAARGRALNRRIEVEFWHDDPLEDLPDEPQICPESEAAETVERVYNPPEGDIKAIYFEQGQPQVEESYYMPLRRAMEDIKDKANVRLRFIGYTSNKRLDRRTAQVYGDDVGLSTSRARRAMEVVKQTLGLRDDQVEFEGRGFVQSKDVAQTGFIELDKSKVEVQVLYDELAQVEDSEGITIKRITRDVATRDPFALNLMRISVDGQPLNDPNKSIPDVSRCTDVALDKANLQFKFDDMELKPRLNVVAWPNVIAIEDNPATEAIDNRSYFRMYSNYPSFIAKSEVRLFAMEQSVNDIPLAIIPLDAGGNGSWQYDKKTNDKLIDYRPPRTNLKYVLRVYDKNGKFDETETQELWLLDKLEQAIDMKQKDSTLVVAYGENRLLTNHIPLSGGTIKLLGENVPEGHQAVFAGQSLPIGAQGKFAGEFILPNGLHNIEVAIVDAQGNGYVYQRKISLDKKDWFYVGMADLTVARDFSSSNASLVTGDSAHFGNGYSFDGRFAFYAKGKFGNDSTLTMSADTREEPLKELFSNFLNKDARSLFRRIDPDYYYPTYGDDSRVEENAPTAGKFYLKWQKQANYAMWGNFNLAYVGNDLAHVDRRLYGGNFNYESDDTTSFGEKLWKVNLFAASPGTVAGRDEFLSTGGSLYFLRHQDISSGSDRVRIEVRDRLSGLVMSVKNLNYGLDYDIDYIQGRISLTEPLSSWAPSDSVVNNNEFGGQEIYLVVRYEYTPGFEDLHDINSGGNLNYWVHDRVKMGFTLDDQHASNDVDNALSAYDVTYRLTASSWVKFQQSHSRGSVSSSALSIDGGYQFAESSVNPDSELKAGAWRGDASIQMSDVFDGFKGRLTLYNQELDAGYNAPGIQAQNDTVQRGYKLDMPVPGLTQMNMHVKADNKTQKDGLENKASEIGADYRFNLNWSLASGIRVDSRRDNSTIVPETQQEGERTDLSVRVDYDSKDKWSSYGFTQSTVKIRGNRDNNDRIGLGGAYRLTDRFKLDGELSGGDLGTAYKIGGEYKLSTASDIYSHYVLENERSDNGIKARKGSMVSGYKHRYSDTTSMYMEEKYTHGDLPSGITHAMGVKLNVSDKLNMGASIDVGKLKDNNTAAEIERKALAGNVGYKFENFTLSSALELRLDRTQVSLTNMTTRKTWLSKNTFNLKLSDDWRFVGKLNYSQSISSLGDFYAGNYTEAVAGYAYRPIKSDKWTALYKYTYFYNLPTVDQLTPVGSEVTFLQKSHIWSTDVNYELTRHFSLGGKVAYRLGKISTERENQQFFVSNAALYITRVDWEFATRWNLLTEARLLSLPQIGDKRSGMLLGIYRQIGKHFRFGGGYNFTDFSDDLTDLDYDSQGVFINLLGKF